MRLTSLKTLYQEHHGKVSDKWSLYLSEYERLFAAYQKQEVSVLEIGVQNGGSLEIYGQYFSGAKAIIGCDVDPSCLNLPFADPRIKVVVGDANFSETAEKIFEAVASFDLIIDDGSHKSSDIIRSFSRYFPRLKEGGTYIVEDLHCSYWQEFEGGLFGSCTPISFFKKLTDILNYQHWGIDARKSDILSVFTERYGIEFDESQLEKIHSIEFINSMCIIHKCEAALNELGYQFVAGDTELVIQGRKALHGKVSTTPNQSENPWRIPVERLIADRDEQIVKLAQAVACRDEQIANLARSMAIRDERVASLGQVVTERDGQIANFNQVVAAHDKQMARILNSRSWQLTLPLRLAGRELRRARTMYRFGSAMTIASGGPLNLIRKLGAVIRHEGVKGIGIKSRGIYARYKESGYIGINSRLAKQEELKQLDMSLVRAGPTISIVMPVYNTPLDMLSAAIRSVYEQAYQNWELIIVDDNSTDPKLVKLIEKHAGKDKRIKTCFRNENGNISTALNSGLNIASGEFIAVLDHDDVLDTAALYWIALAILQNPFADYVYTDEDKLSRNGDLCFGPFYKPDWSPEYLLGMMYTCHFGAYRASIVREIGGYRAKFDGAQDFDFTLRFLNRTNNVIHVPRVLYHWRVWEQSTAQSLDAKPLAQERARNALMEFLESRNENFVIKDGPSPGHHRVDFLPKGEPLVSIVIPTANGMIELNGAIERHIDAVIKSILERTRYEKYEVIVVHNGDLLPQQEKIFSQYKNITLVHYDSRTFSLSQKINFGCAHANGEYLVIMNDDIRVISEDWLSLMTGMVQREGVGVVGPKLLFPDGTIQHAGVVLLGGLPGHAYYQLPKNSDGYALGAKINRNYLAVTGACAITPKSLFDKVGGYSERYPLNYNDVDYCLKLHQLGYRSVYLANVELYHYEGVSKEGGRSVADVEIKKFLEDWSAIYSGDPYYNPNLSQHAPYQFG